MIPCGSNVSKGVASRPRMRQAEAAGSGLVLLRYCEWPVTPAVARCVMATRTRRLFERRSEPVGPL
jgi:hypothetical protein